MIFILWAFLILILLIVLIIRLVGVVIAPLIVVIMRIGMIRLLVAVGGITGLSILIVLRFSCLAGKYLISFIYLFELFLFSVIGIWMIFLCQKSVGLLDVGLVGRLTQIQNLVVVFCSVVGFHGKGVFT